MSTFTKKNLITDLNSKVSLARTCIYEQEESMAYIRNPPKMYSIGFIYPFCLKKRILNKQILLNHICKLFQTRIKSF